MSTAAGTILRTPDGRALFLKRAKGDHAGKWAFPAGKIEDGETPEQAARRETEEETGHLGNDPLVQIDQGDFVTFREDVEEFEPRLNDEHTEHVWAPMDSPPEPLHPGVAATLKKLAEKGHALDKREIDANGWFEVKDNPISKSGVFQYSEAAILKGGDPNKMINVLLPPEELGSEEAIKSFRLVPWTDDHPASLLGDESQGLVPAEKKGVQGVIGQDVYFKDGILYGNIKVFSEALARKIASGKRELSCGYRCDFVPQEGTYEGQHYQYVQRNVRGNHTASVDKGRRGPDIRVLDAAERFTFSLDMAEEPSMSEKVRDDEREGKVSEETLKFIGDSFNSLVSELEKKGYSKEYATKIAGEVANEQRGDSQDTTQAGTTVADKGEVKDPEGKEDPSKKDDLKPDAEDRKRARDARDAKRRARDARRAKDEMSEEEEEGMDSEEEAEDAEEEKEDEKDESKEARDRRAARDRRCGARDARKHARDRARKARDAKDKAKDKGMDAAEVSAIVDQRVKNIRQDASAAHQLYQRLSPVIGAFDHADMPHAEMAAYGLKKLGVKAGSDPVAVLDAYLSALGASRETVARVAQDDATSSFLDKYLAA